MPFDHLPSNRETTSVRYSCGHQWTERIRMGQSAFRDYPCPKCDGRTTRADLRHLEMQEQITQFDAGWAPSAPAWRK
jgi:hypothetical protein